MSGIVSFFLGAGTLLKWALFTDLLEEHRASIFSRTDLSHQKDYLPPACIIQLLHSYISALKMEVTRLFETSAAHLSIRQEAHRPCGIHCEILNY
jgi:hypothetical protein